MLKVARWLGSVLGIALAACSSSSGTSISSDQAAADEASALCNAFERCSAFFVQDAYTDVSTCSTLLKPLALSNLTAQGTGLTASRVEDCVKALGGASCDDLLGHDLPAACQPVAGTLAAGTPCSDSSQCQSAYCNLGTDGACGACASAPPAAGASCNRDDDCPHGSLCTSGACATLAASGASCDAAHPCKKTLSCKNGVCGAPDEAGASCSAGTCDSLKGLYCPVRAGAVCTQIGLASAGQPCGLVNGGLTVCSTGGHCQAAGTGGTGTCEAAAAEGASCDDTKGPTCAPPAVCSSAKVCTIPICH